MCTDHSAYDLLYNNIKITNVYIRVNNNRTLAVQIK